MRDRTTKKPSSAPATGQHLLTEALYTDTSSLITGTVLTGGVAFFGWLICGGVFPLTIAVVSTALNMARWFFARQPRLRWRNYFDTAFITVTVLYLQCICALTFWAFNGIDNVFVATLVTFVVVVNTMSIAIRSFAIERVATAYMLALVLPVVGAFVWRGGLFDGAAIVEILIAFYSHRSAKRLRAILLSQISYRKRSETMAARFRFAIDNMSHGMAMIDSDLRVVVSNDEFSECFGVPVARPLLGVRLGALVRLARIRGILSRADAEGVLASFSAALGPENMVRLEIGGDSGRVVDLTVKPNEEGGWVLVAQDATEQRRAREALDHAARYDAMTNLPNRSTFEARLVETLRVAQSLCLRNEVFFFDLDRFKLINDTMGHKIGDRVLVESANRLRQAVGPDAFAARWGGDEFVVLRRGTDDGAAAGFAERLIAELSRPIWIEGAEISVGASAGVAVCCDGHTSMETLLQNADMALYAAKRESRGACRLFETAMDDEARERRLLELDLQAALAARTFELRYQPIVDLETGELVSFEALAQWRHPTRGSVSPVVFVPALEDMNLMHVFGAWALQRACKDAASWPHHLRVGVNVSARQMDTLAEAVKRALDMSGLAPERLELEITETAALEAGVEASRVLETVRALGVRIALDDFGTGYSSLSHLMSLPLDKVKIDKGFTQQLGVSRKADVLVANIARLSSQLGMRVTFEGIETEEMLMRARAVGVTAEGQGWLFGRATANSELCQFFPVETSEQAVA